jgi:transposase
VTELYVKDGSGRTNCWFAAGIMALAALLPVLGRFSVRVEELELPHHLRVEIAPLLGMLVSLNEQIEGLDEQLAELAVKDERVKRRQTMPEIGVGDGGECARTVGCACPTESSCPLRSRSS